MWCFGIDIAVIEVHRTVTHALKHRQTSTGQFTKHQQIQRELSTQQVNLPYVFGHLCPANVNCVLLLFFEKMAQNIFLFLQMFLLVTYEAISIFGKY